MSHAIPARVNPNPTGLFSYLQAGSAVSAEARDVTVAIVDLVRYAERSQAIYGKKLAAMSQLKQMADACAREGWDGDDALPVRPLALADARTFIRLWPESLSLPVFAPEPDGSISLDWIVSPHRLFSISVGTTGRLAFAWLDGTDRGHGVARFDRAAIPERILTGVRSIIHEHPSVGTS
jgi:hypothetical protein